jgi:hypothetical protein
MVKGWLVKTVVAALFVAAMYPAWLFFVSVTIRPPNATMRQRLMTQGDLIIESVEAYRLENGVYPASLSDVDLPDGVDIIHRMYGPWVYELVDNGAWFYLRLGDYSYLFEMKRSSMEAEWVWDS